MRQAVERYGPHGRFWSEHPEVPRDPIRTWQIWNEPNFKYFVARPNPGEYGRLVKRSARAIHALDLGAKVVLGGLFARRARERRGPPRHAGRLHGPRCGLLPPLGSPRRGQVTATRRYGATGVAPAQIA